MQSTAKRREQNRRAQRAFRERKKTQIDQLRDELQEWKQRAADFEAELHTRTSSPAAPDGDAPEPPDPPGDGLQWADAFNFTHEPASDTATSEAIANDTALCIAPSDMLLDGSANAIDPPAHDSSSTALDLAVYETPLAISPWENPVQPIAHPIPPPEWTYEWTIAMSILEYEKAESYAVQTAEWLKEASQRACQKASLYTSYQERLGAGVWFSSTATRPPEQVSTTLMNGTQAVGDSISFH